MKKTIIRMLLASFSVFIFTPLCAETLEGQEGLIVKGFFSETDAYWLIGASEYDTLDKNMGYLAYEHYGSMAELSLSDQDHDFRVDRLSLKGDAYRSEPDLEKGIFTGAKFDLYWGRTEAAGYLWQGVGIGVGIALTPIKALANLHVTGGMNLEPKYFAVDWQRTEDFQYNSYLDVEWFLDSKRAIVWHASQFGHGDFDRRTVLKEFSMFGFRWVF